MFRTMSEANHPRIATGATDLRTLEAKSGPVATDQAMSDQGGCPARVRSEIGGIHSLMYHWF